MIHEWTVQVNTLEELRQGLQATLNHLQAVDIANAAKNLSPETKWSPLTLEVDSMLLKVTGYIEEVAVAMYEADRDAAIAADRPIEVDLTDDEDDEDDVAEPNGE